MTVRSFVQVSIPLDSNDHITACYTITNVSSPEVGIGQEVSYRGVINPALFHDLPTMTFSVDTRLDAYIARALRDATFDVLSDDEGVYAEVPGLEGVYATGDTREAAATELAESIRDWVNFRRQRGLTIPSLQDFGSA